MKKKTIIAFVVTLVLISSMAFAAGQIVTPPKIMMPYGSDVVTEISLSDSDLLKVVKGTIPILGEVIKGGLNQGLGTAIQQKAAPGMPDISSTLQSIDLKPISEAIEKVEAVRILVAKYPAKVTRKDLLNDLDNGARKMGSFRRIISDVQFSKGVIVVYAEGTDKGYLAYMYDPSSKMLYAGRLVGFLDVQKIMTWAMEMTTKFMTISGPGEKSGNVEPPVQKGEPAPETQPAPESTPPSSN